MWQLILLRMSLPRRFVGQWGAYRKEWWKVCPRTVRGSGFVKGLTFSIPENPMVVRVRVERGGACWFRFPMVETVAPVSIMKATGVWSTSPSSIGAPIPRFITWVSLRVLGVCQY